MISKNNINNYSKLMSLLNKFSQMFSKQTTDAQIGVALNRHGLAYCHVSKGRIKDAQQLNLVDNSYEKTLQMLSASLGLAGECQLVLAPSEYQIVQIDRPNVSEEEMNQALKWQIKELVSIAPEDMVVDYFDGPTLAGGVQKLNVVCASKNELARYVQALHQNNLTLSSINIEEFAFAQLLPEQSDAHLLLVQQPNEELVILIVKQGQLFFYRRLRGFSELAQKTQDELAFGMVDSISLEIQRSTDFFERQLKQAPIKSIKVLIPNENEAFIARKLSENTNIAVEMLSMPEPYTNYRTYATSVGLLADHKAQEVVMDETQEEQA